MTSSVLRKVLCATVSTLALMTALVPAAQAFTSMNMASVAMSNSTQRDNRHEARLEAARYRVDQFIASPTADHLASAENDLQGKTVGETQALSYSNKQQYEQYALQCQKEINPDNAISANQVTDALRENFLDCVRKNEIVNVAMSKPGDSVLIRSSFLAECQTENGIKPGENLTSKFTAAQETYSCIQQKGDTMARLTIGSLIGGLVTLSVGTIVVGGLRQRKKPSP